MNERRLRKIEDEEWKLLKFTDKKYKISNYGRVKSYCYDQKNGRIVKLGNIKGFHNVSLRVDGVKKSFLVHKLTAEYFVEKTDEEQNVVIHLDWNKQNNYYKNLQWSTKEDSYKRMQSILLEGRKKAGKMVTASKLKEQDVAVIKGMLEKGIKQKLISQLFCVSEMQVSRIARKQNWAEVEPRLQ